MAKTKVCPKCGVEGNINSRLITWYWVEEFECACGFKSAATNTDGVHIPIEIKCPICGKKTNELIPNQRVRTKGKKWELYMDIETSGCCAPCWKIALLDLADKLNVEKLIK